MIFDIFKHNFYQVNMQSKSKSKTRQNYVSVETDFGIRQVSHQNFSRIVALPKLALQNCGIESQVLVTLVQQNGERYLKLSPIERSETN